MTVRELTGDMQLSKNELEETQVFKFFFFFIKLGMLRFLMETCVVELMVYLLIVCQSDDSDYT
jgi:hypothetical protein